MAIVEDMLEVVLSLQCPPLPKNKSSRQDNLPVHIGTLKKLKKKTKLRGL
jgi:hypothetical protein